MAMSQFRFPKLVTDWLSIHLKKCLCFSGVWLVLISFLYMAYTIHENHVFLQQGLQPNQIRLLGGLADLDKHLTRCENLSKIQTMNLAALKNVPQQIQALQTALQTWQSNNCVDAFVQSIKKIHHGFLMPPKVPHKSTPKSSVLSMHKKSLPFQIIDMQFWNGEPMVTICHQGRLLLLGKDDNYAGWTLSHIQMASQAVCFKNASQAVNVRVRSE
jgi:hypothetical protein